MPGCFESTYHVLSRSLSIDFVLIRDAKIRLEDVFFFNPPHSFSLSLLYLRKPQVAFLMEAVVRRGTGIRVRTGETGETGQMKVHRSPPR